ncbi:Oxaloacetate decarboxylase alpha chain [Salmonella enterica subsp. enterica serovar Enteritidis]|nr:Oxaloacetate decarboxylase alpha chain [Salmonella enterica subsp. enterica serovar Enteritidis]
MPMNDPRNMKAALQAVRSHGAHAQGTLSYTTSPAHTLQTWLDLTEQLLETGVDSICHQGYVRHSHPDGRF